jgi:uncharacterized protein (DUF2141 family)
MKSILALLLIVLTTSAFRIETKGTLVVSLSNITKTGKINVAVYREGGEFPDDKFIVKTQSGECKSGVCSFQFQDIPFGEYAIAIYQDENDNGKLDTGAFGVPTEPFAFSNNFKPRWGGPTFDKCSFKFEKDKQSVSITMINSLFGGD